MSSLTSIFWSPHKKERRRRERTRTVFPSGRFSRVTVEVRMRGSSEKEPGFVGRGFLHDLSPEGIGLFIETKLALDDLIEMTLPAPRKLRLNGRVAWCSEVPSFRILKKQKLPYRIGVQFQFSSAEDRQALELICADLSVRRLRGES